jgi:hypothetical protein
MLLHSLIVLRDWLFRAVDLALLLGGLGSVLFTLWVIETDIAAGKRRQRLPQTTGGVVVPFEPSPSPRPEDGRQATIIHANTIARDRAPNSYEHIGRFIGRNTLLSHRRIGMHRLEGFEN